MLVTKNLVPGESVYGEKRISIDGGVEGTKVEYRVWNPFRSKLGAGVLGGLDDIFIKPGAKVLYLGAASGTSVSHVADIVGPVSGFMIFLLLVFLIVFLFRRVRFMLSNFRHVQAEISLTWPRSGPTLSVRPSTSHLFQHLPFFLIQRSSRTLVYPTNTTCYSPSSMSSLPMSRSPTKPVSSSTAPANFYKTDGTVISVRVSCIGSTIPVRV